MKEVFSKSAKFCRELAELFEGLSGKSYILLSARDFQRKSLQGCKGPAGSPKKIEGG